jgi:N-acetylglucosaminyldiphosphoundecaprenol N-acetyl-beta-D-mannosaminyltransferase
LAYSSHVEEPMPHSEEADREVDCVKLLGVRIHRVDMATTMGLIRRYIAEGRPRILVTADASGVSLAQRDEDFRKLINNADLVTPDGSGILWACEKLGMPLIERVSGVDIARNLCAMAAEEGFSIYFLGAAPGVAEQAAENLKSQYPGLRIAGTHDGYFEDDQSASIAAEIKASGAKGLLVAMGIPRQEKWIRDHLNDLGVCVAIGVGGSFDVFSGNVSRAPEWMQRHGLEWAYRLSKNPRKISKVAELPRFARMVLIEQARLRGCGGSGHGNGRNKGV